METNLDITLDFALERARDTQAIMETLAGAPYLWSFDGPSPGSILGQIQAVEAQIDVLAGKVTHRRFVSSQWDTESQKLVDDAQLGTRAGRIKYKAQPVNLHLFKTLKYPTAGRDNRYKQAHAFEKVWNKLGGSAWNFKTGLTFEIFKQRREALLTIEDNHVAAETDEKHERALLHSMADDLNTFSVDWYAVATETFGPATVPGQLIRTIPTTYDPARPPGKLRFTAHMSGMPNTIHLAWRASRGQQYYISALAPDGQEYDIILDGVTDTEWIGLSMTAGLWKFKGHATNQYGEGAESDVVEITVAQSQAA